MADGEWVRLASRRGELEGRATYTEKMRAGEVFVPFVKLQKHAANFLTNAAFDPNSKIPEYKVCAVRIEKVGGIRSRREEDAKSQPRRLTAKAGESLGPPGCGNGAHPLADTRQILTAES